MSDIMRNEWRGPMQNGCNSEYISLVWFFQIYKRENFIETTSGEIGNEYENFKKAFPQIPVVWMEVSAGDEQVLLIQAEDLL